MREVEIRVRELTPRQCAILNESSRGHENKIIAYDLGISEDTVKTQLKRAYRKLAVASREDAARRHHRLKTWKGHVCATTSSGSEPVDDDESDMSPDEVGGG